MNLRDLNTKVGSATSHRNVERQFDFAGMKLGGAQSRPLEEGDAEGRPT